MPSTLPTVGVRFDASSYPICGTRENVVVAVGEQVTIQCPESDQQFRYVIVQSLDTEAERLCLAEVGVFEAGQYAILHMGITVLLI